MTANADPTGLPPAGEFQPIGGVAQRALIWFFVFAPLFALLGAIPAGFFDGWLSWHDAVIAVPLYSITRTGIGVGYHRYFTHGSFKPNRPLKIVLGVAGSMALEGPLITWVADHRRHHQFSDRDGDPHSPWRYGTSGWALTKGFCYAHMVWLLDAKREQVNEHQYAKDLLKDRDLVWISRLFPLWMGLSVLVPPVVGGLWSMSWHGALTALFWGSFVRIGLMHHVTFSINSICHVTGKKPFKARDKSGNVWWLAWLSGGESWHNLHHADPTCARHGVLKGQIDIHARYIWVFERLGWVHDVRWPVQERINARRVQPQAA